MTESKREEIKLKMEAIWDSKPSMGDVISNIQSGYVFGDYGTNEHLKRTELIEIAKEIKIEKAPVVSEEV